MTRPRRAFGKITAALIALGVSSNLGGCTGSASPDLAGPPPTSATTGTAPTKPAGPYDISRIANIRYDFPSGFTIDSHPAKALNQQDIDGSGIYALSTAELTPSHCRSLLLPPYAEPSAGSHAAAVLAENEHGTMYVIALGLPQPIPASAPPGNCDEVAVHVSPRATGTGRRIAAPIVDGAVTTGVKVSFDNGADPDYIFTAALNDRTTVVVIGSTDPELGPQHLLSDLLVKAATRVRGF